MTAGAGRGPAPDDLEGLNRQVVELYRAGKYAAATPMAERVSAPPKVALDPTILK